MKGNRSAPEAGSTQRFGQRISGGIVCLLAAVLSASTFAAHGQPASVATYQAKLAQNAAIADALITANEEMLTPSCLAEVEAIWRSMRNAYSSTGGQLPLSGVPFERGSPELNGYVAALVDQSERASREVASKVAHNCRDPFATSFEMGEVTGQVGAMWNHSIDALMEGQE